MKKRTIAVDFDDVLILSALPALRYYNQTFGTNVADKDYFTLNPAPWGVKDSAISTRRIDDWLGSEAGQRIAPLPETVHIVRQLSSYHELHVVTGRPPELAEATQSILDRFFLGVFRSVKLTSHMRGGSAKSVVCQSIGVDLLIDDLPHHVQKAHECGIEGYLFGGLPWTQINELPKGITRVRDWQEIAKRLLPKPPSAL